MVGGRLKTPADADSESLQAKWVGDLSELSLRARDVVSVVERGRQYREAVSNSGGEDAWHEPQVVGEISLNVVSNLSVYFFKVSLVIKRKPYI